MLCSCLLLKPFPLRLQWLHAKSTLIDLIAILHKRLDRALFLYIFIHEGEGEGEVAFFSAKRWDRRNGADLTRGSIEWR